MVEVDFGEFSLSFFWRNLVVPAMWIVLCPRSNARGAPGSEGEMRDVVFVNFAGSRAALGWAPIHPRRLHIVRVQLRLPRKIIGDVLFVELSL